MRKLLPAFLIVFCVSAVSAQTPTPTPEDVVRISTNIIQLDVTVTDGKGNVVTDLRRDEIEVYENGKRQDISGFSFSDGRKPASSELTKQAISKNLPTFVPSSTGLRPENVRRTIALVVDDLSLSFENVPSVRWALRKFVLEQVQDGDLVAIIRTGGGMGALQQFTMDRNQMLAAIDKVKFGLSGKVSAFEPITFTHKEELQAAGSNIDKTAMIEKEKEFDRQANELRNSTFMRGTLGALNYIIRGMSELPGRKSVVLLSEGMSLIVRDGKGKQSLSDSFDLIREMVDNANRASVVFYTLDARGLIAPGVSAQDDVRDIFEPTQTAKIADRENALRDTQDGLKYIAKGTGGLAYINQNDLSKGIEKVLEDNSYYLIAYEPDADTFDAKTRQFNKIEIKVTRPGLKARYRSGFFSTSDEQIAKTKPVGVSALSKALSSPFSANEIQLRFNPVYVAGDANAAGYVRSYLHIDADNITFAKKADGDYLATFEIAGVSLGDNGAPTDWSAKSFELTVPAAMYERVRAKGIVHMFTYAVKRSGPFQYRIAIRDVASNKVGSVNQFVTVPDLKKDRLSLSGFIFEDASKLAADGSIRTATDPIRDTAIRQFRKGAVIRYGLDVYNAEGSVLKTPDLTSQVIIFRDGVAIYKSSETAVPKSAFGADGSVTMTGTIKVGAGMSLGEHFLQIIVTDKNKKGRAATTAQFVSFEVTDK